MLAENHASQLPPPARYTPFSNGRYEVAAGLRVFGTDFGNGSQDTHLFQIDHEFLKYRQNKQAARRERLEKYYRTYEFSEAVAKSIAELIICRLTTEHPDFFRLVEKGASSSLECRLTGEELLFDSEYRFEGCSHPGPGLPYVSLLDALASQVQEDLAVWRLDSQPERREWLDAIHLCAPNHWAAEEKIGRSFMAVHAPVADFDKLGRTSQALVDAMISKGPYVRFAWGIATDTRLNHHPHSPEPSHLAAHGLQDANQWNGRAFDSARPELYLRVERQGLWGLPETGAAVFTIRTYFLNCKEIKTNLNERDQLAAALRSMSPEARRYKGLVDTLDPILKWLESS